MSPYRAVLVKVVHGAVEEGGRVDLHLGAVVGRPELWLVVVRPPLVPGRVLHLAAPEEHDEEAPHVQLHPCLSGTETWIKNKREAQKCVQKLYLMSSTSGAEFKFSVKSEPIKFR